MKYLACLFLISTIGYAETMEFISADIDSWTVSEGTINNIETQLRYRPNLKNQIGRSDYPLLLKITWEYSPESTTKSLPYSDDLDLMHSFENKLVIAFEENNSAIFSHVYTSNGVREWYFYINDKQIISSILNSTLEPGLPIGLSVKDDSNWSEFSQILRLSAQGDNN